MSAVDEAIFSASHSRQERAHDEVVKCLLASVPAGFARRIASGVDWRVRPGSDTIYVRPSAAAQGCLAPVLLPASTGVSLCNSHCGVWCTRTRNVLVTRLICLEASSVKLTCAHRQDTKLVGGGQLDALASW